MIACLLSLAFLIVCCFLPFASGLTMTSGSTGRSYGPAFSFFFGGKLTSGPATYQTKTNAVLPLLGYIFILLSVLLLLLSFLKFKSNRIRPLFRLSSLLLTLTFSILMICSHRSLSDVLADALLSSHSDAVSKTIYERTSMDFGIYGVSIFGFLSSISSFVSLLFDSTFDKLKAGFYR